MGTGELRIRLGTSREHVHDLVIRRDFPHPYADLAQGKLWLTEEIRLWHHLRRETPAPLQASSVA